MKDKEILLQDLCSRLSYGVRLKIGQYSDYVLCGVIPDRDQQLIVKLVEKTREYKIDVTVGNVKPYLRPMSSMTEEEWREIRRIQRKASILANYNPSIDTEITDYLNSRMLDLRLLIPA